MAGLEMKGAGQPYKFHVADWAVSRSLSPWPVSYQETVVAAAGDQLQEVAFHS